MSGNDCGGNDLERRLSREQFEVTQHKATERPFSGRWLDHKEDGFYVCICCGHRLFDSEQKFDSGSGWPSFRAPADEQSVSTARDTSHGMLREEALCGRCKAHLGHVFDDGPPPQGLRYCINSASLDFRKRQEPA